MSAKFLYLKSFCGEGFCFKPRHKAKTAGEYLSKGNTQNLLFGCQFAICVHSLTGTKNFATGIIPDGYVKINRQISSDDMFDINESFT